MSESEQKPKVLILASGSKDGGGSGAKKICEAVEVGNLPIEIVAIVSNHATGGVRKVADKHGVRFVHLTDFSAPGYRCVVEAYKPEWILLSGWLKLVRGLDSTHTFNIHPGPLPEVGGNGMHGEHVHENVISKGMKYSAVTMHFVTDTYDTGPQFFRFLVPVAADDTGETLYKDKIRPVEHGWQWLPTMLVVTRQIHWDGGPDMRVFVPAWYKAMPFCPETCVAA